MTEELLDFGLCLWNVGFAVLAYVSGNVHLLAAASFVAGMSFALGVWRWEERVYGGEP